MTSSKRVVLYRRRPWPGAPFLAFLREVGPVPVPEERQRRSLNPDGLHFLSASSRAQPFFRRSEEPALSAVEGISRAELAQSSFTPPSGV